MHTVAGGSGRVQRMSGVSGFADQGGCLVYGGMKRAMRLRWVFLDAG